MIIINSIIIRLFLLGQIIKAFFHNGSIYDPYFNVCSSELKKTLWFVIFSWKKETKKN